MSTNPCKMEVYLPVYCTARMEERAAAMAGEYLPGETPEKYGLIHIPEYVAVDYGNGDPWIFSDVPYDSPSGKVVSGFVILTGED